MGEVRQFLDLDDGVEDVGFEAFGDKVGDDDGASERQNVLDLARQFADDDGGGDGVRGRTRKRRSTHHRVAW